MSASDERDFRIHPAIGFARLGNATRMPRDQEGWFLGPERPDAVVNARLNENFSQPFRQDGAVRAQGVRFRVFEYGRGEAQEIIPGSGRTDVERIIWHVRMVNRKAAFFRFLGPLGRRSLYGTPLHRFPWLVRNRHIARQHREDRLVLDTGVQSIRSDERGALVDLWNINPHTRDLIDGLGQMLVDHAGRLVVLGGRGRSVFFPELRPGVAEARSLTTYANNDGWFDDIADGPVTATLYFKNAPPRTIAQDGGAWVVTTPPDFAPGVRPIRSLWDTLIDVYVRHGTPSLAQDVTHQDGTAAQLASTWDRSRGAFADDFRPSFTRTIYPILSAAGQLIAAHSIPSRSMAHRGFTDANMAALGGSGSDSALRRKIFERIRPPRQWKYDTSLMPVSHGDIYLDATPDAPIWRRVLHRLLQVPGRLLTVSELQYALLEKWQAGCFQEDWNLDAAMAAPGSSATTAADQDITPAGLDEAALREASGGAFVPGIECSWILTSPKMYGEPFRLAHGKTVTAKSYVGSIAVNPGIVTAQMALPWQADFADCKKEAVVGELVEVAWWPWQRPDDVLLGGTGNREGLGWAPWAPRQDTIADDSERFRAMVAHWRDFDFIAQRQDGSIGPMTVSRHKRDSP